MTETSDPAPWLNPKGVTRLIKSSYYLM